MQDPTEVEFETDDIYLASFFSISGCVLKCRRKLGNKVVFIFTNPGGPINELREAYYSGKALVKAHQYSQCVQSYKKLCFDL